MTSYSLREGVSHLAVCLRLQGGKLDRPVDLTLSTRDGTAQANADYNSNLVVTDFLPADNNQKCVDIAVTDDKLVEVNETFVLVLTTVESAISLSPDTAMITIIDNDRVTMALKQSHIIVQESIGELKVFVELTGALQREVTILLESMDGSASSSLGDFTAFSEMLTFPPNSVTGSTITFTIKVEDDHLVEGIQYFTFHATSMDKAVQFEPQRDNATVFIEDNDGR